MSTMILSSPEFKDGATLNKSYQADADNASPELIWDNVPEGTASFAVAMHDPDAPTGGAGWWHWFVWGIPADTRHLPRNVGIENSLLLAKEAVQMKNDGGSRSYMGCLPPVGDPPHRYVFTVYALGEDMPDISPDDSTSKAGFLVNAYCLDKASLTAYYSR